MTPWDASADEKRRILASHSRICLDLLRSDVLRRIDGEYVPGCSVVACVIPDQVTRG